MNEVVAKKYVKAILSDVKSNELNVFVENEDGSRKVYSKQLNTNNFKGEPIVINADREYTINIVNPTIALSKIFLEYETKEVSL